MINLTIYPHMKTLILYSLLLPCITYPTRGGIYSDENIPTKPHASIGFKPAPLKNIHYYPLVLHIDKVFGEIKTHLRQKFNSYTVQGWQRYLASCDPTGRNLPLHLWSQESRNAILCQYNFYQFAEFRNYIATLPDYHETIIAIHNHSLQHKTFAQKLDNIPIRRRYSVKDFIGDQVIESKKIVALEQEKQRNLQKAAIVQHQQALALQTQQASAVIQTQEKELTAIVETAATIRDPQTRYEKNMVSMAYVIKKSSHENFRQNTQEYTILSPAERLLQTVGLDPNDFLQCHGNAIQQLIHHELVISLNRAGDLYAQHHHNPEIGHIAKSAVEFAHVAVMYNNAGYAAQAFEVSNLCSALCDYGKAFALGIKDGAVNIVHAITHPIDTVTDIARTANTVAYFLGKVLYELGDIELTYQTDPSAAEDKIRVHIQNITAMRNAIHEKSQSLSGPEILRGTMTIITEAWITKKCLSAANTFYTGAQGKVLEFAKKVEQGLATTPELLASAEGLEVRIASEAADLVMLSTKQGFNDTCRASLLKASNDMLHYVEQFKKIGLDAISQRDLKHIFKNHIPGGQYAVTGERSVFYENVNVIELAIEAWSKGIEIKTGKKIFDAGQIIGFTIDGIPTSKVSVSLNGTRNAIKTIFPV